jgi:hypothetical protein
MSYLTRHTHTLLAVLLGFGLNMISPQVSLGLDSAEINKIARQVTVFIQGTNNLENFGSGFIIQTSGQTYTVLTAGHVVDGDTAFTLTTPDGVKYVVNQVKKLPGVDLALLQFESRSKYPAAILGKSDQLQETNRIYVAGFPKPGFNITTPTYTITGGDITAILQQNIKDGYALAYTNPTRVGMSGGPVFNQDGQVVAIHGRKEGESDGSVPLGAWLNLGIPIRYYETLGVATTGTKTSSTVPTPQSPPPTPPLPTERPPLDLAPMTIALTSASTQVDQVCGAAGCRTVVKPPDVLQSPLSTNSPQGFLTTGNNALKAGDYEAAIQSYSSAINLVPTLGVAHVNRAIAYHRLGRVDGAIADLNTAATLFRQQNDIERLQKVERALQQLKP